MPSGSGRRCAIFITAQEILVDHASYPTERIAANSHKFRPLGLGYANLGSLLMASGLPYDSEQGAGAGRRDHGDHARPGVPDQRRARAATRRVRGVRRQPRADAPASWRCTATRPRRSTRRRRPTCWPRPARSGPSASSMGRKHGYRNSQVTVLAPTGTIAFMMDCDTTGIEPDIALVKYKQLAGGGMLKIVNRTVPMALRQAGV